MLSLWWRANTDRVNGEKIYIIYPRWAPANSTGRFTGQPNRPINWPISQATIWPMNWPTKRPINWPTNQPTKWPTYRVVIIDHETHRQTNWPKNRQNQIHVYIHAPGGENVKPAYNKKISRTNPWVCKRAIVISLFSTYLSISLFLCL